MKTQWMNKFCVIDSQAYQQIQSSNMPVIYSGFFTPMATPTTKLPVPVPSKCPCCHEVMSREFMPVVAIHNATESEDHGQILSSYRCPSCNEMFSIWSSFDYNEESDEYDCKIIREYPVDKKGELFPEYIADTFSESVEIFHQAEISETLGLTEICGMGYRKAVEFLIDGYVRIKNPDVDIDPKMLLGDKIRRYVTDNRIKTLAQRAAWLGNDETHVETLHPDRDVSDIKNFYIQAATLINADHVFEDAQSIQGGK